MKDSTVILIILVFVVLMAHNPKKTTAQITSGEDAAEKLTSTAVGGLFGSSTTKGS